MKQIRMPVFLHEVFGEKQSLFGVMMIFAFGGLLTAALLLIYPQSYRDLAVWRSLLAYLLVFDIFAGCIANFTASTSNYYSSNKKKRIVFISIHFHLIVVALLLDTSILPSVLVWAYTIAGAFLVNGLRGGQQLLTAGVLLAGGLAWIPMLECMEPYMLIVSLLFMLKVLFSFSVDHYGSR
ncbi:hypothetical protein SAMN05421736_12616 [Evansella caseinilytica]|uniref:Uncharacterized protein n=1 Tax=Evansella caseinilytica TaxID=1503961 RepID=A0A1H3UUG1_9BACI|nr:hypothetical protein [Evansella caseinilytica]SDZ65671.1 hypothetical protein SAMN05421736_12616 [Evansella caseinilytica]